MFSGLYTWMLLVYIGVIYVVSTLIVCNCDPKLMRSVQALQLTAQYVNSCTEVLETKCGKVREALDCFQREEDILDLQLNKLRYNLMHGYDYFLYILFNLERAVLFVCL